MVEFRSHGEVLSFRYWEGLPYNSTSVKYDTSIIWKAVLEKKEIYIVRISSFLNRSFLKNSGELDP